MSNAHRVWFDVRTLDSNGRTLELWPAIATKRYALRHADALACRKNDGAASVIVEAVQNGNCALLVALYGDIEPAERFGYSLEDAGYLKRK